MANIPAKIENRIKCNLKNIQKKAEKALSCDVSEAQTVSAVVKPFLTDILGYDEFEDLTDQYVVRGTFCDIAIKANGKPYIMVEAKAIGVTLKDAHAKQAKDYGINSGVQWIVLTNGIDWNIYKIIFKKDGVSEELVLTFKLTDLDIRKDEDKKKVFYLCKEAILKSEIENLYEEKKATNRYLIGNLLLKKDFINLMRRELKKLFPDTNISSEAIQTILKEEVIRRDIFEAPETVEAIKLIEKAERKEARAKAKKEKNTEENTSLGA